MPKKLSDTQKKEMVNSFSNGMTIDQLSDRYEITKITITRHLKKEIDEKQFKNILEKNNKNKIDFDWFNSEEYKMIKKMQNCKVKYLDGSFGTCNPYNSYRNPNLR